MFNGLFGWLRASVRAAVIGGVQDAIAELTTAEVGAEAVPLRLTFRREEVSEAPVEAEPAPEPAGIKGRKKA